MSSILAPGRRPLHALDTRLEATSNAVTSAHADLPWNEESDRSGLPFDRWSKSALTRAAEEIVDQAAEFRYAIAEPANQC